MFLPLGRYVGRDPCNTSGAPLPYFPNADCDSPGCDAAEMEMEPRGNNGRNNGNAKANARGRRKRDRERQSLAVTCGNRDGYTLVH